MITVALIDDHILLRDMLAGLINTFEGYEVICTAANGKELVSFIEKQKAPDIAILDLNMPEMNGYATAAWLKKEQPNTRTLMLTMYDSEVMMVRLMALGVRGFLKKDIHPADLKNALLSVIQKGHYYHGDTSERLANLFRDVPGTLTLESVTLSEKEIEFIRLACTDLTYKEIGEKMHAGVRTVDSLRDALFAKLQVKSRVSLVLYAVNNGILIDE